MGQNRTLRTPRAARRANPAIYEMASLVKSPVLRRFTSGKCASGRLCQSHAANRQMQDRSLPYSGRTMITVDDISALSRWADPALAARLAPVEKPVFWSTSSESVRDQAVLRAARLEATTERPLHVLVPSAGERVRCQGVVSHVWSTPLPDNALYHLTPEVLLASPQFCLQGISARGSLVKAVVTAMEICGDYGRTPHANGGFFKRPPLARLPELREHFDRNHGYGAKKVRRALRHVVEGSRSPMETVVILLFTLPVEMGGCGLPDPEVNVRVEIPPDLRAALGKPYVVVDLCWRGVRIILEYDSYLWHSTAVAVDSDSTRNEGLRDLGWMVRSVTVGMLTNDRMRRHLVSKVMERFGRKLPATPQFDQLQHDLIQELLTC